MQLHNELASGTGPTKAAVHSPRGRKSAATRKVTIRLTEKLHDQLQAATERPGVGKSMVVETALENLLNPQPAVEDPARDSLDELNARFESLHRDLRIVAETVALHARYHLAVMPALPQPQQRAACMLGDERFKVLADQVDRRVRLGQPLIQETMDRLHATGFAGLEAESDEVAGEGAGNSNINSNETSVDPDQAGTNSWSKREEMPLNPDPERVVTSDASQKHHLSTWRLILSVFAPFAAGYYLAYLFRTINSAIAPALATEFGLDASQMGLLASVYFLVFGLAQIPIGLFLDRFGPRRVQSVLLVIAAGGATLFGTASGFPELFIARAMIGLGVAGSLMAGLKAVVLWFPRERVALVNGWMIMLGALGAVTATAPTEWLLQWVGWRDLFEVLTIATAAVGGLIYIIVPEHCGDPEITKRDQTPLTLRSICSDPRFLRVAPLSAACIGSSWALQSLWASAWLSDVEGFDRQSSQNQMFLMAVGLSLGALLLGAVADRLRRHNIRAEVVLASVAALFVVAELALVLRLPLPSLLPWSVVSIAGAATVLSFAVIADYFPKEFAARASGALNLFHFGWAFLVQYGIGLVVGQWAPENGHYPVAAYQAAFGVTLALQAAALVWFSIPSLRAFAKRLLSLFARPPGKSDSKTEFVMVPIDGSILVAHEGVEW